MTNAANRSRCRQVTRAFGTIRWTSLHFSMDDFEGIFEDADERADLHEMCQNSRVWRHLDGPSAVRYPFGMGIGDCKIGTIPVFDPS